MQSPVFVDEFKHARDLASIRQRFWSRRTVKRNPSREG